MTNNNFFKSKKEVLLSINRGLLFLKMSFLNGYIHFCQNLGVIKSLFKEELSEIARLLLPAAFQLSFLSQNCSVLTAEAAAYAAAALRAKPALM